MKIGCVLVCLGVLASPGWSQVIGKVPPPAPPTPAYEPPEPPGATPPPPPPASPRKPAEADLPLPTLVIKDQNGKVHRYPEGAEQAAINAYPFDAETKPKVEAALAKRSAELERLAVDRLEAVLEARRTLKTIGSVKTITEFDRAKQVATPLQVEKASDRLLREGVITPVQHNRLEQMVKDYEGAIGQEVRSDPDFDIQNIFNAVAVMSFEKATRDLLGAFERLAGRSVRRAESAAEQLGLSAEQRRALGPSPDVDRLVGTLSVDQLRTLLTLETAPAPSP